MSITLAGLHARGLSELGCTIETKCLITTPIPPTHAGVGCSVIAFVLASRLAAVVMSTAEPRASPKNDKSTLLALPPLSESSATISTHIEEDDDSLSELEKQPHFSDQDEASDTAGLQLETTLSTHIEEDDDSLSELEKQPHFSDQDEASDTAGLQLETTLI